MVVCMKTTLNLPDALLESVKQRASQEGRTMTSFVEEALRARLVEHGDTRLKPVDLPSWGAGSANGYLVDLEDRDAVWDVMDGRA